MLDELKSNTRLRILLALAVLIGWAYALAAWSDHNAFLKRQLVEDQLQLQRLQPSARPEIWRERQEESRQRLLATVAGVWSHKSASQAETAFRDWISNAASNAEIKTRTLSVTHRLANEAAKKGPESAPAEFDGLPSGYGILTAQFEAPFNGPALVGLLDRIESEPRRTPIIRLSIKNPPQGGGSIELELRAVLKTSEGNVE